MANDKELGVQFKNIKEISFNNKITDDIVKDFDSSKLQMRLTFNVQGSMQDDSVSLTINVFFKYNLIPEKPKEIFQFSTCTLFKFTDHKDSKEIKIEETQVFIGDKLMQFLLNIAIGATRGMLSYKTSNLPFDLVMPIIDLSPMFPEKKDVKTLNKTSEKIKKLSK